MTAGDVERLAQALGVWRDGGVAPDASSWGNGWSTRPAEDRGPFDTQTAALILLGHAAGLRVDVGECPACRERGSKRGLAMWEWRAGEIWDYNSTKDICDEQVQWLHGRCWVVSRVSFRMVKSPNGDEGDMVMLHMPMHVGRNFERHGEAHLCMRPCQACTIDGAPTGRHTLPLEAAIIAAMPRPARWALTMSASGQGCWQVFDGDTPLGLSTYSDGYQSVLGVVEDFAHSLAPTSRPEARGDTLIFDAAHPRFDCPTDGMGRLTCVGGGTPGDAPTREALAVMSDHLQAHPDPCGLCHGERWAFQVDAVGPGVTLEQMNPRRETCMVCEGKGVDEHGEAKMLLGQCVAAWLGGVLGDMQGVLDRLVASAILNAE